MHNNEEQDVSSPNITLPKEPRGFSRSSRWIAGVFYFDRDDPDLLVPKRSGLGTKINFGYPLSWRLAGGVTLVVGGVELALFLSTHDVMHCGFSE